MGLHKLNASRVNTLRWLATGLYIKTASVQHQQLNLIRSQEILIIKHSIVTATVG